MLFFLLFENTMGLCTNGFYFAMGITTWPDDITDECETITIQSSSLTLIPEDAFDHFTRLDALFLMVNSVTEFPNLNPVRYTLSTVTVSGNLLDVPFDLLKNTTIYNLNLKGNHITQQCPEEPLVIDEALQNLDLSNNLLTTFCMNLVDTAHGVTNIQSIRLTGNI